MDIWCGHNEVLVSEKQLSRGGKGWKGSWYEKFNLSIIIWLGKKQPRNVILWNMLCFIFQTQSGLRGRLHPSIIYIVEDNAQPFFHVSLPERFFFCPFFYLGVGCFVVAVLRSFRYFVWWHGVSGVFGVFWWWGFDFFSPVWLGGFCCFLGGQDLILAFFWERG